MRKRSSLMIPFLCTFIAYNVVIGSRSCFCYWSWSTSCSVYPFNILIHFLLFLIFKIATAQPHDYVLQQPCVTPKIYIHTYIPISQCVHIYVQHKIDSVLMLQRRGKAVWTNVGNETAIIIIFLLVAFILKGATITFIWYMVVHSFDNISKEATMNIHFSWL